MYRVLVECKRTMWMILGSQHLIDGGVPQPLKMYGGSWYGVVNTPTHTGGFMILKKILEKNLVDIYFMFYLWLGGWVCL